MCVPVCVCVFVCVCVCVRARACVRVCSAWCEGGEGPGLFGPDGPSHDDLTLDYAPPEVREREREREGAKGREGEREREGGREGGREKERICWCVCVRAMP